MLAFDRVDQITKEKRDVAEADFVPRQKDFGADFHPRATSENPRAVRRAQVGEDNLAAIGEADFGMKARNRIVGDRNVARPVPTDGVPGFASHDSKRSGRSRCFFVAAEIAR